MLTYVCARRWIGTTVAGATVAAIGTAAIATTAIATTAELAAGVVAAGGVTAAAGVVAAVLAAATAGVSTAPLLAGGAVAIAAVSGVAVLAGGGSQPAHWVPTLSRPNPLEVEFGKSASATTTASYGRVLLQQRRERCRRNAVALKRRERATWPRHQLHHQSQRRGFARNR